MADLLGQTFGRLTVTESAGKDPRGQLLWRLACDCGGTIVASTAKLRSARVRSCGCQRVAAHRRVMAAAFGAA